MRKIFALLFVVSLLLCVLASCLELPFGLGGDADTEESLGDDQDTQDENDGTDGADTENSVESDGNTESETESETETDTDGEEETGTDGLEFTLLDDGTYGVSIGTAKDLSEIVIPSKHQGIAVSTVLENGFTEGIDRLETITVSNGITTIESNAFKGCGRLKSLIVPNTVTKVGEGAFAECNRLRYNEYDNGYYLGDETNPYLIFMKVIRIAAPTTDINENTRFVYDGAFSGSARLSSLVIPDNVTSIGARAFQNCMSLKSVTLSNSVSLISTGAFQNCTALESVNISSSVTTIGEYAFFKCDKLVNIVIPDNVTRIEAYAFYKCFAFENATLEDPEGWGYIANDNTVKELHSSELSVSQTAAEYLTLTYTDYIWIKK